MIKAIPFFINQNFGRRYSKMIVYDVCINLQADFVGVASSFCKDVYKPPEGRTKGQDHQL